MAQIILLPSQFTGVYALPQTPDSTAVIQSYISLNETEALYRLMSSPLAILFITEIQANGNIPVTARFIAIYNQLMFHNRMSKGIPNLLLAVIYYYYVRDNQISISTAGMMKPDSENGLDLSVADAFRQGETRFNSIIESVECIQHYIRANKSIYPEACFDTQGGWGDYDGEFNRHKFIENYFSPKFSPLL